MVDRIAGHRAAPDLQQRTLPLLPDSSLPYAAHRGIANRMSGLSYSAGASARVNVRWVTPLGEETASTS
jgi:hypothetical protein